MDIVGKTQRIRIGPTGMRMRKRENKMAKTFACAAAFWVLCFAHALAGNAQQPGNPAPNTVPPLRIGSGDLIEVSMFENPGPVRPLSRR